MTTASRPSLVVTVRYFPKVLVVAVTGLAKSA
jgi:hypothetical protein